MRPTADAPAPHHVVLLHGLFRTRRSLAKLSAHLEASGYLVVNDSYPSTRRSLVEHAEALHAQLAARLCGREGRLSFVTHSLGGIVARAYLARYEPPCAVNRVVMLAPPNQGAQIVDRLRELWLFRQVAGRAGMELGRDEAGPADDFGHHPVPDHVEVGIIAGGTGDARGYAPWIDGDNDGTVSVASTRLAGSVDHILVPHIHTFIMNAPDVLENVVRFLEGGRFLEAATRPCPPIEGEASLREES
jgi:triacylglycerol lipase